MPTTTIRNLKLDARPDRIDFRDLPYRPPLVSLPDECPSPEDIKAYFPRYAGDGMVLDQGDEGACTGFGLAAVVNYLRWERLTRTKGGRGKGKSSKPPLISPRMLYQNARLYDEWRGEDYDGSSCRGAMKGFHKHGVCSEAYWPYREKDGAEGRSRPDWDADAAKCPLGAYYRVDAKSLVDMQAAINEVHAIFVSSDVHNGWTLEERPTLEAATIRPKRANEKLGGHAFCLVGYRPDGFIVQNSWGPAWGYKGFAILPYDEWTQYGYDAWVLALGAPMLSVRSPASRTTLSLEERSALRAPIEARAAAAGKTAAVTP
ncbi:MAG: C1 family peptidase, partial [Propylenella sp.]